MLNTNFTDGRIRTALPIEPPPLPKLVGLLTYLTDLNCGNLTIPWIKNKIWDDSTQTYKDINRIYPCSYYYYYHKSFDELSWWLEAIKVTTTTMQMH